MKKHVSGAAGLILGLVIGLAAGLYVSANRSMAQATPKAVWSVAAGDKGGYLLNHQSGELLRLTRERILPVENHKPIENGGPWQIDAEGSTGYLLNQATGEVWLLAGNDKFPVRKF